MTSILRVAGDSVSPGALMMSDLPFPPENLVGWVDADHVIEAPQAGTVTETRITSLVDVKSGAAYTYYASQRAAKIEQVGTRNVMRSGMQAGAGTLANYRGYALGVDKLSGLSAVTFGAVIKANPASAGSEVIYANEPASGSPNGMVAIEWMTPTSIRVRAKRGAVSEAYNELTLSGIPAEWIALLVTIDFVGGKIIIDVPGYRRLEAPAFVGNTGPAMTTTNARGSLFRRTLPDSSPLGGLYSGQLRCFAYFGGLLTAKQAMLLPGYLRDQAAVLNSAV